jgi:hypothetical protein
MMRLGRPGWPGGEWMGAGLFLIGDDNQLVEMVSQAYDSEALLQQLLARYPNLLAGDQIDAAAPRRWLLLSREMAVPDQLDGAGRWSLDHLLVDQDAVPTLIEVKRSSDTRIRREVVGQMLDYAANAVAYLPVESLRSAFLTRCNDEGLNPDQELAQLLRAEADVDDFWQRVKTNLQAGRLRLVFVADEIPPQLRRIVEFLNQQMDPAEVLAVEIRQYVGGSFRTLVPRVFGQTEQAQQKKSVAGSNAAKWDESSFLEALGSRQGVEDVGGAKRLLNWGTQRGARFDYGSGVSHGSVFFVFTREGRSIWPIALWTYGKIEIQFQHLLKDQAFESEEARRELQRRLNAIPGVNIPDDGLSRRPSVAFSSLRLESSMQLFTEVLDWVLQRFGVSG